MTTRRQHNYTFAIVLTLFAGWFSLGMAVMP